MKNTNFKQTGYQSLKKKLFHTWLLFLDFHLVSVEQIV